MALAQPTAHWGGRMIWQLSDSEVLLVAWHLTDDSRPMEKRMIADFVALHGRRPFANRTG